MTKTDKRIIDTYPAVFIAVPLLLSAVLLLVVYKPAKHVIPYTSGSVDTVLSVDTYSDSSDGGKSTADILDLNENHIAWTFTLRKSELPSNYAGIYIAKASGSKNMHFDLSGYTDIHLSLELKNAKSLYFYLKTFIDDYSEDERVNTYARFRKELYTDDGIIERSIPLEEFIVPEWWKNFADIHEEINMNAAKTLQFDITNGNDSRKIVGENVQIRVNEISFTKNINAWILAVVLVNLFYFMLIALWKNGVLERLLTATSGEDERIIISYDKVEMKDEQEEDINRITEQISKNYSNPTFNVEQLAKEAGVSTSRIPSLLKKKFSMNFKQYLNMVRVTEAKRLLLETEHQIVSIAHSVGYNNIPHFNRTFKQYTGLSPKKYRQNPEEAIPIMEKIRSKQ
ncbi:MAG: helix-turn-helix domain-containing protein [Fibrobacterota bacterium]